MILNADCPTTKYPGRFPNTMTDRTIRQPRAHVLARATAFARVVARVVAPSESTKEPSERARAVALVAANAPLRPTADEPAATPR